MMAMMEMMASHFEEVWSGLDFNPQDIGSGMILDGQHGFENDEHAKKDL